MELLQKCTRILQLTLTFGQQDPLSQSYLELRLMNEEARRVDLEDLSLILAWTIVQRFMIGRLLRLETLREVSASTRHGARSTPQRSVCVAANGIIPNRSNRKRSRA